MIGRLIVIEGLDGSGKATQTAALAEKLQGIDAPFKKISFPDYESQSSALVKMYLSGEIGSLDEVNLYAASNFYSLDRYISYMREWKKDYLSGKNIIADRYTTSNLCHQMSKLPRSEWGDYIKWLEHYEYVLLGLPRPDLVIYLDMPPEASQRLMLSRYGGDAEKRDIHEKNAAYLARCREAALFSAGELGWRVILCAGEDKLPRPIEEIASEIMREAKPFLNI